MYPPNGAGPGPGMPSFSGRPPGMPPGMPPGGPPQPFPAPYSAPGQPGPLGGPPMPMGAPYSGGMPPGGFVPPGGPRPMMMPPPMPGSGGPRPMGPPGGMPYPGPPGGMPPPRPGMPGMMGAPPGAPMMMGMPPGAGAPFMAPPQPGSGGMPGQGPPRPFMAPGGSFSGPPLPGGAYQAPPGPGGAYPPPLGAFPPPPGAYSAPPPGPGMMQPGMMQQGMGPPPQQQQPGGYAPPGAPGYGDAFGQQMADQFESLTLGSGVGVSAKGGVPGSGDSVDPAHLPRPIGDKRDRAVAPQPLFDTASCSARNMRLTVNGIPNSTALKARWSLPMGVVVHPMADEQAGRTVPVVSLSASGIVRCRRCRTYMNPFVEWTDGGRRFKCNVCVMLNEIPVEYFCALDHNGRRRDADERPEISTGTVEYVAPAEYMVRPPMPPVYMFVIDVSHTAVNSGMLASVVAAIRECLEQLPGDERTLVGFITFDSTLHFYNLKPSLAAPQMLVVTELDEPFVPLPDDLLVNLRDSLPLVQQLLDTLPATFAANNSMDCATGPALQAAYMMSSHVGCKLLLFQAGVPSLGIGKVKNRENVALYNTEREATLRGPEDPFFKRFAAECNRSQIGVDVFVFGGAQYMDLASLAALPRFTCGEVYYYPSFNAARDGPKVHHEVVHNLVRPTAWEAVMRVRCSKGLKISSFHGHFFNRSTDLLALPVCDPDKAFAVQIQHEETMVEGGAAFVQCALLYTNSTGERRIRVHTLAMPIVTDLAELYKGADAGALACIMAKLAVEKSLTSRLDETRNMIQAKMASSLKEFRLLNASAARQPNKFVFPETLKFLPLWSLGMLKSAAIRGGAKDVTADERIAVGHDIMSASVESTLRLVYPDLYVLHDPTGPWGLEQEDGMVPLPPTAALSMTMLSDSGAYLLDNGRVLILWLGRLIAPQWCVEVFGAEPGALPLDGPALAVEPARDTHMSQRVNAVLRLLRARRPVHAQCFAVRQGSPLEIHVAPYFVEDRSQVAPSYSDYMLALHRTVLSSK